MDCVCMYIYSYRDRERERETDRQTDRQTPRTEIYKRGVKKKK